MSLFLISKVCSDRHTWYCCVSPCSVWDRCITVRWHTRWGPRLTCDTLLRWSNGMKYNTETGTMLMDRNHGGRFGRARHSLLYPASRRFSSILTRYRRVSEWEWVVVSVSIAWFRLNMAVVNTTAQMTVMVTFWNANIDVTKQSYLSLAM